MTVFALQWSMDNIVKVNVKDMLPYLDNVIIGGGTEEHDKKIKFLKVVKRNLTE